MKTTIISIIFLSSFIFSCNSDDENAGPPPIPENEKFIDNITSDGTNYKFEYNEDKTVSSLDISGFMLLKYTYENNRIATISIIGQGQAIEYHLEYDQNGRISSFSLDDVITQVTYNETQNYYLYQKESGEEFTVFINENEDVYKTMQYDPEYDELESTVSLYNNSAKGVLTNTNNITVPSVLVFGEVYMTYIMFLVTNKPIDTFSLPGGNLTFENELDVQGFVSGSTIIIPGENPSALTYNYIQL